MIKARIEQVIDCPQWDDVVEETYGRPYNLQQQDGCMARQGIKITVPCDAYDFKNDTVPEADNISEIMGQFQSMVGSRS